MPEEGFEPSRSFDHRILSPTRLPLRHSGIVRMEGVEPSRPSAPDPKSGASASFATLAFGLRSTGRYPGVLLYSVPNKVLDVWYPSLKRTGCNDSGPNPRVCPRSFPLSGKRIHASTPRSQPLCRERDLNPHALSSTSPSDWRDCHYTTSA